MSHGLFCQAASRRRVPVLERPNLDDLLNSLRGSTFEGVAFSYDRCKFIDAGLALPRDC